MFRVLKILTILLGTILITVQPVAGIVNKKKNTSSHYLPHFYPRREHYKRKSYLDADRPLWVLEDKVTRPGEIEISTHIPFKSSKRRFISSATFSTKLPSHYVNLNMAAPKIPAPQSIPRNHKRTQTHRMFPVFDDFETDSEPILIYRGPKAEMIFNTMMTSRQYPMAEPVPGQVMYPPYSPKFKPTPVVERVPSENYPESVFHNVTLIPFYAHEAVDPTQLNYERNPPPEEDLITSDEVVDNEVESENYLTDEKENGEPSIYHSYYSQDDVQAKFWSLPFTTPPPSEATTMMSLNRQLAVPNGIYPNHQMEATTPKPRHIDDSFRIMYDSDDENPPLKRYKTVHTAKYGGFKTLYPVYTLNKLLRYKPHRQLRKPSTGSVDIIEKKRKLSSPAPEETWLIWDARHKSTHTSNYQHPMSTKHLPANHKTSPTLDNS